MEDIQNHIEGNGLRWFRHVKRMDEHRYQKRLLEINMSGKRSRDTPRTWWLDRIWRGVERKNNPEGM
jgi:hypothetical protein